MYHLQPWQHLWIGDTNPSDEGEDSWIYNLWYKRRTEILTTNDKDKPSDEFALSLRRITFALTDNLLLTEAERVVLKQLYADDPGESAREYDGLWVKGHGNKGKHFSDLFSHSVHVIGDNENSMIELHSSTETLYSGWDLGSAVNHAAVLMEKRLIRSQDGEREWPVFSVLDELLYTDEQKTTAELGLEMLDKMRAIEDDYGRQFTWVHYSDDTAINVWRPSSGTFDYLEILSVTDNQIRLLGVPKPQGSVQARVRLLRRLLREHRFYVSASCKGVISMIENCKKGSTTRDYVEWNEHKHMFDAVSYVLFMECAADLEQVLLKPHARVPTDLSMNLA